MEKSSKRGKIPQSDWPSIMARYEAGETLSSIARTYDCSPPAISYIISRSRARQPAAAPQLNGAQRSSPVGESQLIKASAANGGDHATHRETTANPPAEAIPAPAPNGHGSELRPGNGHSFDRASDPRAAHAVASDNHRFAPGDPRTANADPRARLHLALGNGNAAHTNGGSQMPERQPAPPQPHPEPHHSNGGHGNGAHAAPQAEQRKETHGAFIDRELRGRVEADITAFLAAFDAALAEDTPESRAALRDATDRLLRAGARTRIELERLEARAPLPHRDSARAAEPAWRQR
jgi:hypothetical protein